MRGRATLPAMLLAVCAAGAVPAAAQPCAGPETMDLITGASATGVDGVAEYEVIATSRTVLGVSVAATRRIWGGVTVDRWLVHPTGGCANAPTTTLGDRYFVLVGLTSADGDAVYGLPHAAGLSDLERGALAAIVGEPVHLDVGAMDRSMAWIRVNWWWLTGSVALAVVAAGVARALNSRRRRDYLF